MRRIAIGLLLAMSLAVASPAVAAQTRTSLTKIESEVMCPICGTLLELSDSPQAQREKVFISGLIAKGRTEAQIKDALVAEYGNDVLALPRDSGFDLSAYIVPVVGFVLAIVALGVGVTRWRRDARPPSEEQETTGPQGKDAERLDADLARYDL